MAYGGKVILVKLLFFGATADSVGSRELELSVEEGASSRFLIDQLSKDHPALVNHKLLIAVNEEYADPDTILNDGDEIAVFTPVSGG